MTVSFWRRALRNPATTRCDVLVIGAGICGMSAALHLQRRGLNVHVVEQHTLGWGASSRNAGFLMRGAADHYADAVRLYGRPLARVVWKWTEENLAGLRSEGIESLPSYRRIPSALLALDADQAAELAEARRLLVEDGFDAPWQDRGDDSTWRSGRIIGALLNPADGAVNPVELLRFLAAMLSNPLHEHEEVYSLATRPEDAAADAPVCVQTSSSTVIADRVLVCTNAYAPLLLPSLAGVITPRRGQMLALSNASGNVRLAASYYANHGSEYFRHTADGSIVVGGCRTRHADRETGYDDTTTEYVQRDIESFADTMLGHDLPADWRSRLPGAGDGAITARWAGTMGFSPDGLPLIGPVGPVWFCGAFTGHGMSMAYRASLAAVEAMLDGAPNPLPISRLLKAEGSPAA